MCRTSYRSTVCARTPAGARSDSGRALRTPDDLKSHFRGYGRGNGFSDQSYLVHVVHFTEMQVSNICFTAHPSSPASVYNTFAHPRRGKADVRRLDAAKTSSAPSGKHFTVCRFDAGTDHVGHTVLMRRGTARRGGGGVFPSTFFLPARQGHTWLAAGAQCPMCPPDCSRFQGFSMVFDLFHSRRDVYGLRIGSSILT